MTTATETAPVTALTGVPVPGVVPGSAAWLQTMSASKVAAALGLSPYESPFSLWHRMAGRLIDAQPPEPQLLRGHYLEDGVRRWFLDQHPDWKLLENDQSFAHPDTARYTASPDGTLLLPGGELRGYEGKTAADDDEWGQPGTDEIPAGYRAQVIWQQYVTGLRVTHIACLSAYLDFREYVVTYDQAEAEFIVAKAQEFIDSLPGGPVEQRPAIDTHGATYEALRRLHPLIDGTDVEIDPETARQYCHARHALKAAEAAETYAKSLVVDELGLAKRARYLGKTLAYRQAKGDDGVPFLVAGKHLPTFDEESPS